MKSVWRQSKTIREELARRKTIQGMCGTEEPSLMYSTATVSARAVEVEQLSREHRRGLHTALGVFYQTTVSNIALYERSGTEQSITVGATRMRRDLFRKILRRSEDDPAIRAVREYYES